MVIDAKDRIRADRSELLRSLAEAGANVAKPNAIRCPFHDDKHASAGVYQDESGAWRFKCQAATCGVNADVFDVRQRTAGKSVADQLRELREADVAKPAQRPKRRYSSIEQMAAGITGLARTFTYTNPATGQPDMIVFRIESPTGKRFLQARRDGDEFVMEAPPKPWPIYNRSRIAKAEKVVVVEGEKCVHALADHQCIATTSPAGAGKASLADWTPLAGKHVWLWPDNDAPDASGRSAGIEHMREVASLLERLEPRPNLYWIDPVALGIPVKGDAVEYLLEWRETPELAIKAAMQMAEPMGAAGELSDVFEDIISGRRYCVPWPWESLHRNSKALLPGTVTCVCGDPGSTKSFFVLQAAAWWYANGHRVALYELEEDRAFHLNRLLAQLDDNADLIDDEWIKSHPDEARDAMKRHGVFLNEFGRYVYSAPDQQVTLHALAAWVRQVASAGARVIIIDPVTAAAVSDKPWIEDLKFLMECKSIVRTHGASLVLVTHPRKGKKSAVPSLDDLAGGAAYPRFAQTVMWIIRHQGMKRVKIKTAVGISSDQINRSVHLYKARNGRGTGFEFGFQFYAKTLSFSERGIVYDDEEDE